MENNNKYTMHGEIEIYDDNNNLIQKKSNMIVKIGRRLIREIIWDIAKDQNIDKKKKLQYFYELNTAPSITIPEMSIVDTITDNKKDILKKNINTVGEKQVGIDKSEDSNDNISITFTATISIPSENENLKYFYSAPLTAVGLLWDDGKNYNLFSRAAVDPIYLIRNRTYTVKHTIYF